MHQLTQAELFSWYGPWEAMSCSDSAALVRRAGVRWWIGGGWALEAAGMPPRHHGDVDIVVLERDLPALLEHLRGQGLHPWAANAGALHPLLPGASMPPGAHDVWLRRGGDRPWLLEVISTPMATGWAGWAYPRDQHLRLTTEELGVTGADGLPYLRPEVALLFKAELRRTRDEADFAATLPLLSGDARRWLATALPAGHPWLPTVAAG